MQQKIDPKRIRMDLGTQARVQTDSAVVGEYAAAMLHGDQFPPIHVFHDRDSDLLILVDGFHRLAAHMQARPDEEIDVTIKDGTLSDARWTSFTVNTTHGLRRSTADKRRIIAEALRHEKGVKMSDRQIAGHVGVDHKTVATVRHELMTGGEIPHVNSREGKDGKAYAVKPVKAGPERDTDDEIMVSLPKFRDGNPEFLLDTLLGFFKEDYLQSLAAAIHNKFNNVKRKSHTG